MNSFKSINNSQMNSCEINEKMITHNNKSNASGDTTEKNPNQLNYSLEQEKDLDETLIVAENNSSNNLNVSVN
jgi:hypothetical protein